MPITNIYKEVKEYQPYSSTSLLDYNNIIFLANILLCFVFSYIMIYDFEHYFKNKYFNEFDNYIKFFLLAFYVYLILKKIPKYVENIFKEIKITILKHLLSEKNIKFFNLKDYNTFRFNDISPNNMIFYTIDNNKHKKLISSNNHFILLNSHSFNSIDLLKPYCHIIICSQYTNVLDAKNLWYYFLSLYFSLNIIYSAIIFIALYGTHFFIDNNSKILLLGLFISLLTYFFGRTLWIFIKNIHFQSCNKENIINTINGTLKKKMPIDLSKDNYKNKIDEYFLILNQKNTVLASILFEQIDEKNKDITNKITAILQIAAPLFYLAYITITVAIFIKFTP